MSTHVVPDRCHCGHQFEEGERAYYLGACKLVSYGQGGYDGIGPTGRGAGARERRVVFFGGKRKDREAVCLACYARLKSAP